MKDKSIIHLFFVFIILGLFLFSSIAPSLHTMKSGVSSSKRNSSGQAAIPDGINNITLSPATYAVSFTVSGLPTGTSWWVILGGNELTSTSSTITFQEPDGTYSYQVDNSPPSGTQYTVSPSSGTVTVYGYSLSNSVFYTVNYYLTTNANPQIDGIISPSSGWYMAGETLTLFASPNYGYSFSSWTGSGSGSYSGTSSSPSITLNGPITETANFYQQSYAVTFTESGLPSGTTWWVNIGGQNISSLSSSITFNLPDGTYDYTVMDSLSNGVQYQTTSSGVVSVAGFSATQYIYYNVNYYLTVSSSPSSSGSISPSSGWYPAGEIEFLTALPNTGYSFSDWTGSGSGSYSGTSSSPSITLNGPITETAYFVENHYSLTFQESGLPAGKNWWVNVGGHNLSSTSSSITFNISDGTYSYILMNQIGDWAKYSPGNPSGTVTVFGTGTIQYVYYTTSFYVGVDANPSQDGSVSPSSGWIDAGNYLFLSEFPNSGYAFSSWSGNGTGSYTGSYTSPSIQVTGPLNETAHFFLPEYQVSFTESGLPSGTTWWVNMAGENNITSAEPFINFTLPDGTYQYTIGQDTPPGALYAPSYSNGLITVFGSSQSLTVFYSVQYYLNITNSPSTGGASPLLSGWYFSGSYLTLNENPLQGYNFVNWTGIGLGSYSGNQTNPSITIDGPINETANFIPVYRVTFLEKGLPQFSRFTVSVNGIKETSYDGNITYILIDGNYSYNIGNETGYMSSVNRSYLTVDNTSVTLTVNFTAIHYSVMLIEKGLPAGKSWSAELSNGTTYYSSDSRIVLSLIDGFYSYKISSFNEYVLKPLLQIIDVHGSSLSVNVTFISDPIVHVHLLQPESNLTLNGISVHPINGIYNTSLSPGFYYVNVSYRGYLPYSNLVNFQPGKNYTYNISLVKLTKYGSLFGTVTPGTATIMADSISVPVIDGHFSTSLSPGTYFVTFSARGYESLIKEINITSGSTDILNVTMNKSPFTSTLYGYVLPENASLVVNGFVAYVNTSGYYRISLPDGYYHLSIYSKGFFPASANISLFSNQIRNFTLVKEPVASSTTSSGKAEAQGFNVTLTNLRSSNGFISVDFSSESNGSIVVSMPFSILGNSTISEILNSTVFIDNKSYHDFTISISSNYSILLKVYGLSKGDPTLYWKYSPTAIIPSSPNIHNPLPLPLTYLVVLVSMAIVGSLSVILFVRKHKK